MENSTKQIKFAQRGAAASQTCVRHGWIPVVVYLQSIENKSSSLAQRQFAFYGPRGKNTTRKQSWVDWAKK